MVGKMKIYGSTIVKPLVRKGFIKTTKTTRTISFIKVF